jgi:transcriptional regulator NrdR family protein
MLCPVCGCMVWVSDSVKDCDAVYRRRQCKNVDCGYRFYTSEYEEPDSKKYFNELKQQKQKEGVKND